MSTEEMLSTMEKTNEDVEQVGDCVVGSTDVKALYPSLDVEFAAGKGGDIYFWRVGFR